LTTEMEAGKEEEIDYSIFVLNTTKTWVHFEQGSALLPEKEFRITSNHPSSHPSLEEVFRCEEKGITFIVNVSREMSAQKLATLLKNILKIPDNVLLCTFDSKMEKWVEVKDLKTLQKHARIMLTRNKPLRFEQLRALKLVPRIEDIVAEHLDDPDVHSLLEESKTKLDLAGVREAFVELVERRRWHTVGEDHLWQRLKQHAEGPSPDMGRKIFGTISVIGAAGAITAPVLFPIAATAAIFIGLGSAATLVGGLGGLTFNHLSSLPQKMERKTFAEQVAIEETFLTKAKELGYPDAMNVPQVKALKILQEITDIKPTTSAQSSTVREPRP